MQKATSFSVLKVIVEALEPLAQGDRDRVLRSALEYLGMSMPDNRPDASSVAAVTTGQRGDRLEGGEPRRRVSLVELVNEKRPRSNAQLITLFAYYKERIEREESFHRADLKAYFARAKQRPAGNYDRDFSQALANGWISQDGEECYITSTGIEAVESGFAADANAVKRVGGKSSAKKRRSVTRGTSKRKARKK